MKLIASMSYISPEPSVVALGCFDGVHLGHAAVIEKAVKTARALGCPCTVWTFAEPPKNFFLENAVPLITDVTEKQTRIASSSKCAVTFSHRSVNG